MFRPAKLGRDCFYGPGDPGHEYIPGLTETFFGPLAEILRVEGERAGVFPRGRLYEGRTPNGADDLLAHGKPHNYRPVIGGNFHASKTMNFWLADLSPKDRSAAERLFVACCKKVVEEHILPEMESRTGHAGAGGRMKAEAMAVLFKHGTNSAKEYHLHVLVEIHNAGLCPDGKVRTVDSEVLFKNQSRYSLEAEALVMRAFQRMHHLVLRPGPNGSLEVKGMEAARDVPTRRQGQIIDYLERRGQDRTVDTVSNAVRATHQPKDPNLTVEAATANTRSLCREHGIDPKAVVIEPPPKTSALAEQKKAEAAVVRALHTAERLGLRFTEKSLTELARREGLKFGGVDTKRVTDTISDLSRSPDERAWYGIQKHPNGLLTTAGVEQEHAKLFAAARMLARAGRVMSGGGEEPAADLKTMVETFRGMGQRVHVVAGPGTANELGDAAGVVPERAEAFAAQVGDARGRNAFRSATGSHALEVADAGPLQLGPTDTVVLDVRNCGAKAAAHIAETAARTGASVVLVGRIDPPEQTRTRNHEHEHDIERR